MNRNSLTGILLGALGAVTGLVVGMVIIASIVAATLPWNWSLWYNYNRQATNVTYIHAAGGTVAKRNKVLGLSRIQVTSALTPQCPYAGRDLFNPHGATSGRPEGGLAITFFAGGSRQTVVVPSDKIHQSRYNGKGLRVNFAYTRVVFFYDHNWDSLFIDDGAAGPKQHVIDCMEGLSLGEKMQIGMKYATFFIPRHAGQLARLLPAQ